MGYFIVNQLPEGVPDEDVDKVVELMAKLDALTPDRLDLWLGSAKDCAYYAALKGFNPHKIRVLDRADKAVGYHCPLRIHLCGKWRSHDHCKEIKYYFDRLAATKMADIEFVTEA